MKKNIHKIQSQGENIFLTLVNFCLFVFTKPGFKHALKIIRKKLISFGFIKDNKSNYNDWMSSQQSIDCQSMDYTKSIDNLPIKPLITIVMIFDGPEAECVSFPDLSVNPINKQFYDNWELFITCKGKLVQRSGANQNNYSSNSDRIQIHQQIGTEKYIDALNEIINNCSGTYVLFTSPNYVVAKNLLYECVQKLNRSPLTRLIYTDEDEVDKSGKYLNPFFKQDWAPDSLLSRNYIGNTFLIQKELFKMLNGFRKEMEGAEFYDLLLRAAELTSNISHIPKIVMHKFQGCGIVNTTMTLAGKKALEDALTRRSTSAIVTPQPGKPGFYDIDYSVNELERVSIVIPTKDQVELLKTAIDSILLNTEYPDYEIIIINNNSTSTAFFTLIDEYKNKHPALFSCIDANFPFNFSKLINLGVANSTGKYILMLNNDVEVIQKDWMRKMVSFAQHPGTGAVGVKLLYPGDTIQHAGIVTGVGEATAHVFVHLRREEPGYFNYLQSITNYSAVTAACLMVRKSIFDEVGGMDELLPVEYNDVDFCLKLLQFGYFNVYIPGVELYHYESATRGHPFKSKKSWQQHNNDLNVFRNKWGNRVKHDRFYNKNLTVENTDFSVRYVNVSD